MTRFEVMSEEQARKIIEASRRALRAILAGDSKSADALAYSFQSETFADRLAARRRLRSVTDDMSAEEYRTYLTEKRGRLALAMANAVNARRKVSRREDTGS